MMTGHLLHDFQNLNFPRGEIIRKMGFALYFQQAEIANRHVQRTDIGSHNRSHLCPTSVICITKALSNILHGPQSTVSSHIMSCLLHCPIVLTQMFTISPISVLRTPIKMSILLIVSATQVPSLSTPSLNVYCQISIVT